MREQELAEFPFSSGSVIMDGYRMAFLDEGEGECVVMVHGNPSWSYLYRNLVSALRPRYRCLVPDHMGCGRSDKPQRYPYRLRTHVNNLERLLDRCGVNRCVLVVHDWGGAIGMGWAGRHPERVAGLVVLNTAAFPSDRIPLRISVCRWPLLGALLVRGANGFARAATFMAVRRRMRPSVAAGFLAPYGSWRDRVAVHAFVRDIPLSPRHPSMETLVEVERSLDRLAGKPMLICWGGGDFCFDDHFYEQWRCRFPDAEAHYFPDAGHYVLEDALEAIRPLVSRFLARCSGPHSS